MTFKENNIYINVKDFSVSGESFSLLQNEDGSILKTTPTPSLDKLPSYYESDDYISHTDGQRSFFEKIYQIVKRNAIKQKVALIAKYSSNRSVLDIGAGTGDFLVEAKNQGWNTNELQFEIVNTIDGAVTALTEGTADYFMWEHFMTKPLVDKGIFRRLADCPTPWPCFVIAVREEILATQPEAIATLLEIINAKTRDFKAIPNIDERLATTYHQKIEDIKEWLSLTEWSQEKIDLVLLEDIQRQLLELEIVHRSIPVQQFI